MIIPPAELSAWLPTAVRTLYWDGIVRLPWTWTRYEALQFRLYLRNYDCFNSHVLVHSDKTPRKFDDSFGEELLCHRMETTVTAPGFMEFILPLTEVAEQLFGEPAKLFSCNSFWTRPGKQPNSPHIQEWHRDRDDRKFLALFMYGTDVLEDGAGPHLFAKGTHRKIEETNREPTADEPIERIYGPAGTFFFSASYGLHMGLKPRSHERLLSWARWCVSDEPYSYKFDGLKPIPASHIPCEKPTDALQDKTKLVIDWNA